MTNAWGMLVIAGLLETAWVLTLRLSEGWTRWAWSGATVALMAASFLLLGRASRQLPGATAYAVWVGIGATGAALLSPLVLKESLSPRQLVFVGLVVIGVVGLRLSTSVEATAPAAERATSK